MSLIGTRVGNYEVKSKIGEGGMGAVYLGEHPLIGKKVAIKVLLPDLVNNANVAARFFNEAKAANDIRHQNIVDIVDFGELTREGGHKIFYLIMELLEGESLTARLEKGPLEFSQTVHILQQCCSGLAASHAKGIIHRDLKPDNLFIVRHGSDDSFVKILDFGIAKLTVAAPTNAKTRTGAIIGTPVYMSPEQCAGRSTIDARSDIYSLGVVMYEMLTGKVPFVGEGFGDIMVAHLTEPPKPPRELRAEIPEALEAIVLRAIAKEPDKRFASMEEFGLALADPARAAARPAEVAAAGAAAAKETTSVPVLASASPAASDSGVATVVATKKKNTTLEGAASEVREAPRAGRRVAIIGAAAAVTLAAVGAGVLLKLGKTNDAPPAVVATPPPAAAPPVAAVAPPPPAEIEVALRSDPEGADVVRVDQNDAVVGKTPLTLKLAKGSAPFEVQLKLAGYRVEQRIITADVNREVDVNLIKQPLPTSKRAARAPETKAEPKKADEPKKAEPVKKSPDEDKALIQPEL